MVEVPSVSVREVVCVEDQEKVRVSDWEELVENELDEEGSPVDEREVVEVGVAVSSGVADDVLDAIDGDHVWLGDSVADSSLVRVGRLGDGEVETDEPLDNVLEVDADVLSVMVVVKVPLHDTVEEPACVFVGMLTVLVADAVVVAPVRRPTRLVAMLSAVNKNTRRSLTVVGLDGDANFASEVA